MKKAIIVLILIFNFSCSNKNKTKVQIVTEEIKKAEYINYIEDKIIQYRNSKELKSKISDDELKSLTSHKNPTLRAYVYRLLIQRELIKPIRAFEEAMLNNEHFSEMDGDIISNTDVCTEIYFELHFRYPILKNEMKQIDSLILYKFNQTHFLQYMALTDKKHEEKHNEKIINMALEQNNMPAVFYLVRNNIEVDKLKLKESIKSIIKKGHVGILPTRELNEILINIDDKN